VTARGSQIPTGRSWFFSAKSRQARKPSETLAVKSPVLKIANAATSSPCSTTKRNPIGPPPVLNHDRGIAQGQAAEESGDEVDVAVVGVPPAVGGLVRPTETGIVGNDHPVAAAHQWRDHLPEVLESIFGRSDDPGGIHGRTANQRRWAGRHDLECASHSVPLHRWASSPSGLVT